MFDKIYLNEDAYNDLVVIIVPEFIKEKLKLSKTTVKDIVDFSKMRRALSTEDLIDLLAYQTIDIFNETCFNDVVFGSKQYLESCWVTDSVSELEKINQKLDFNLNSTEDKKYKYISDLLGRISNKNNFSDVAADENSLANHACFEKYEIFYLNKKVIALVVKSGIFERDNYVNPQTFFNLAQDLLQELYVHLPRHEVATTPIFRYYLKQLAAGVLRSE